MRAAHSRGGSPSRLAAEAIRELARLSRPVGGFDARRYFRSTDNLEFFNVGTAEVRGLARTIESGQAGRWSIEDAIAFANVMMLDPHLEAKHVGVEVVARFRREFNPRHLSIWKRWLAGGHSANWATTDAISGYLIGPLLAARPELAGKMLSWARHRTLWVRRAAAVSLVPSARKGVSVDVAYRIARMLQPDREDLIHKAVGWLLREAGRYDPDRLWHYLLKYGPATPRTTLRYAIERMPPGVRRDLLRQTRQQPPVRNDRSREP